MKFLQKKKKRIYLDYAAATPLRHRVSEKMRMFERDVFANPSAIHADGVRARVAIDEAREKVARLLKLRPQHVTFTGSGTESNNLAIMGAVEAQKHAGVPYTEMEVVTTRMEHPSISNVMNHLISLGVTVRYMDVDEEGLIVQQSLRNSISTKTVIVSFAYVNSEIGVVQDVGKLARIVRAFEKDTNVRIYTHLDAAQAPLWLSCEMDRLMVDIITLDAGKCYGPKGVGVLAVRHGVAIASIQFGGPQEGSLRPSTENTAGIVGAAEAISIAHDGREDRVQKVCALRDSMIDELLNIEGVVLNGSKEHRVANNVNISIPGIDSEFAVIVLDEKGIACATKSACSGADGAGSTVVQEITGDASRASSTLRFTLGEETTARDIVKTLHILNKHILKTREVTKSLTGV